MSFLLKWILIKRVLKINCNFIYNNIIFKNIISILYIKFYIYIKSINYYIYIIKKKYIIIYIIKNIKKNLT